MLYGPIEPMEPEQFEIMDRVEQNHWWYQAVRHLLVQCWQQPDLQLPGQPSVLDAGCGTGGNLQFFQEQLKPSYLGGFDLSPLALQAARIKCPAADVYASDICHPELHRVSLNLIFCCDVIYVPGLAAARSGLERLVQALEPGGQFILHLPAYRWLTSAHDRAVHTRERYVLGQLRQLMRDLNLECQRASYRLCGLLPLIVMKRLPSILRLNAGKLNTGRTSDDLQLPAPWLNRWLLRCTQWENQLIARGRRLPWGSSIIGIGRKPR